jgi:hypothetical protein
VRVRVCVRETLLHTHNIDMQVIGAAQPSPTQQQHTLQATAPVIGAPAALTPTTTHTVGHLAPRLVQRLATLLSHEPCQLLGVGHDQVKPLGQDGGPLLHQPTTKHTNHNNAKPQGLQARPRGQRVQSPLRCAVEPPTMGSCGWRVVVVEEEGCIPWRAWPSTQGRHPGQQQWQRWCPPRQSPQRQRGGPGWPGL